MRCNHDPLGRRPHDDDPGVLHDGNFAHATVTILTIDVLSIGTANVPSVPVRVLVAES